jgi:hypothetical protein
MNPPLPHDSDADDPRPFAAELRTTRPSWLVSILALLAALAAICAALATGLAIEGVVPAKFAVYTGLATVVLLALKAAAIAAGDMIDDGVMNGSFKPPLLALLLLCTLGLVSCETTPEQRRALLNLGLFSLERRGVIDGRDAADLRAGGAIILGEVQPLTDAKGVRLVLPQR